LAGALAVTSSATAAKNDKVIFMTFSLSYFCFSMVNKSPVWRGCIK
jgi:hypothetical protein